MDLRIKKASTKDKRLRTKQNVKKSTQELDPNPIQRKNRLVTVSLKRKEELTDKVRIQRRKRARLLVTHA